MMNIPFIKPDLPPLEAVEGPFREILTNGKITNFGKYCTQFEQEANHLLGTETAALSSGTAGLILTLQALGVGKNTKVIVPSFTFMASVQAIIYAGAEPLFAEIEDDCTVSPADIEALLAENEDVSAVLAVHTYGLPCRVDEIKRIVDAYSQRRGKVIPVIYDAAHAFGSRIKDRKVGSFGSAEVFSLSVTKALVSVEGGMVSSHDSVLIERIRKMRNYGIDKTYNAAFPGLNGKMSEFHAIIGLYNIRRLESIIEERRHKGAYYIRAVSEKTQSSTPALPADVTHTFKDFTIILPDHLAGKRDNLMRYLSEKGVESRAYFSPPVHQQQFFKRFSRRELKNTERLAPRVLTLPFFTIITNQEIDYITDMLAEAERSLA